MLRFASLAAVCALLLSAPAAPCARLPQPGAAAFIETFETGSKRAYQAADEPLTTGSWSLDDALIGSSPQDHKSGERAVRVRNQGRVSMRFDVAAGVRRIRISAAVYGHDGPSTWELWLSSDGGRTYARSGAAVTTSGPVLVAHAFAVNGRGPLRLEIRKLRGENRLDLDDIALEAVSGPVLALGERGAGTTRPSAGYSSRRSRPENAGTSAPAATGAAPDPHNDNLALGNPSGATSNPANANNYLLVHPEFTIGYNAGRGTPNWVSWHLDRAALGASPRQNNFRPDAGLPRQFYPVSPASYARSGFDKGHNCPSGDRTADLDANANTFLMSNMVPQAPQNNQQTWAHLEEYGRAQVQRGLEIYVIMGSYGRGGTGKNGFAQTLDQGRVTVPARIWKVMVLLPEGSNDLQRIANGTGVRVLAVDTPNDNAISPDWRQYLTSVDKIEAATGLTLLSALPPAVQARLKKSVDSGQAR